MYSGTLIKDLMAAVELVEKSAGIAGARGDVEVGIFYLQASQQSQAKEFLAGAA